MSTQWKALLMALGVAVFATGCGESSNSAGNSPAAPPPPVAKTEPAPPATAPEAPTVVAEQAPKAAEAVKTATQETVAQVKDAASTAATAAETKFGELVAQVKKLISDGKGSEAAQTLTTGLANLKLTDSQQKIVDDLKAKAQELITTKGVDAAKQAVGNLLKPKSSN